jgi:hypothetical protein
MTIFVQLFKAMKIKDDSDDSPLLIQKINDHQNGHLWNCLNEDEKEELLIAYKESFDSNNLLSHEQVTLQHEKWLKLYSLESSRN